MNPIQHKTYEDIVNYILSRFNIPFTDYIKDAIAKVLAFGPMHDKFELTDHNHVYNVYVVCDAELFPPQEYNEIEPDSTGIIQILEKDKNLPNLYIENYIRCDDGTGDILIFVNDREIIYDDILQHTKGTDYDIVIGDGFIHTIK